MLASITFNDNDHLHLISCFVLSTELWYCSAFSGFIIMSTLSDLSEWKVSTTCSGPVSLLRLDSLEILSYDIMKEARDMDSYHMEERYCCWLMLPQTCSSPMLDLLAALSSFHWRCQTWKVNRQHLWGFGHLEWGVCNNRAGPKSIKANLLTSEKFDE